ncbi:hypothetical protein HZA44_00265 [Candidatus Peregrinibacteria bacterium]|nr:hypothetical protein [Candidatus Peregrinibacteria bacterium]
MLPLKLELISFGLGVLLIVFWRVIGFNPYCSEAWLYFFSETKTSSCEKKLTDSELLEGIFSKQEIDSMIKESGLSEKEFLKQMMSTPVPAQSLPPLKIP